MLSSSGVHTNQTEYYQQIKSSSVPRTANKYFSAGRIFHSRRRVTLYADMLLQITTTNSSALVGLFLEYEYIALRGILGNILGKGRNAYLKILQDEHL